ncbi:hypothetical protein TWF679_005778 [Orbilia oligospora]|uniref:GST N-terminal domain-containing protein n=1 Tax=Orbilia oligospora TaxID=2813651 RepID=A0A8H8VBB6_ORBOL|nr:hypothetical protein TWF679_005778 [Orbilia oligospora]
MPVPDVDIYPEATGQAAKYFAEHSTEEPLKLYAGWFCPYVQRVLLVLHLKNIPFQYIEVNPYEKPKSLLDLNPRGLVPTLVVPTADGTPKPLFESSVICEYLDEVYSDTTKYGPRLLPEDPYERARARIWIQFVGSNIIPAFHRWLQFKGEDSEKGRHDYIENVIIGPLVERYWVFDEFKGNGGNWPSAKDGEIGARWEKYVSAIEGWQAIKDTTSDKEHYLPLYKRYADNVAQSELAKAIREGRPIP